MAWGALAVGACGDNLDGERPYSVIVYSRQNLWGHASNPVAAQAIVDLEETRGWEVERASDPWIFTPERLASTDVVVFAVTSGEILDEPSRAALEQFFASGGGFVGIHSASATELEWPFYTERLVPVRFRGHPWPVAVQPGALTVESEHPIVGDLPSPWMHEDEFYTFHERPEELGLDLLVALDESSMGADYGPEVRVGYHPLAFAHERSGGRSFYTALGHTPESYTEPEFMGMLERGIAWAAEPRYVARTRP